MSDRLLFIDGQFCASSSGDRFSNINPATGAVLGQIEEAKASDVDRAVQAAKRALEGPWGQMPQAQRLELLADAAEGIRKRFDEFLAAEIEDTGKR